MRSASGLVIAICVGCLIITALLSLPALRTRLDHISRRLGDLPPRPTNRRHARHQRRD